MDQEDTTTIEDMERLYYGAGAGQNAWAYSGTDLLKADSPLMSTTSGTYQAIFGRKVWSQLNQEFNAFSVMPKKPWERVDGESSPTSLMLPRVAAFLKTLHCLKPANQHSCMSMTSHEQLLTPSTN